MSDHKESKFKEHGVMLFLSKDLYRGWIKLQADKDLGRAYAGLLPFTEGLYRFGYISKEVYELHIKKYSQSLDEPTQTVTKEQKKTEVEHKETQLRGMLESWDQPHAKPNWHQVAIAEAQKYPDLEVSKLLLAKVKGEVT